MRVSLDTLKAIDITKYKNENRRQFLDRMMENFSKMGVSKKIREAVIELQNLCNHYIHRDFYEALANVSGLLIHAYHEEDVFIRSIIAKELRKACERITESDRNIEAIPLRDSMEIIEPDLDPGLIPVPPNTGIVDLEP